MRLKGESTKKSSGSTCERQKRVGGARGPLAIWLLNICVWRQHTDRMASSAEARSVVSRI